MRIKVYRYRHPETRETAFHSFEVGAAPDEIDGKLIENPDRVSMRPMAVKDFVGGFVTRQFPKNYPYADRYVTESESRKTGIPKGTVVVSGAREAREIAARAQHDGEPVAWDY